MSSAITTMILPGLALIISLLLMPVGIKLAHRFGFLDHPGKHKRHAHPVPLSGGPVLFVTLWSSVALTGLVLPSMISDSLGYLPYIFCGALIIGLVGFSDDLKPLSAGIKLIAQVGAALILYGGGLEINPVFVPFVGEVQLGLWSILITVAWVVGLTNAINLIDGLDGLAGGVSLIAAVTIVAIAGLYQAMSAAALALGMTGFLIVFLFYNRYPARIFLGDSGAMQLGFYFAVVSLLVPIKSFAAAALYLPLLALGVPILETAISIMRRLATGKNVMKADRRHLFHYLALAGLSPRVIVTLFYLLSIFFSAFALAMYFWDRGIVFSLLALFMVVISAVFFIFMAALSRNGARRRNHLRQNRYKRDNTDHNE